MANPTNRDEFKEWCLRQLGKPVVEVNVDEDQVDDCVDYALQTWWDYHFDGSDKVFYKYQLNGEQRPGCITEVAIANGGTGYTNNSPITFTDTQSLGSGATGTIQTTANVMTGVTISAPGTGYLNDVTASIAGGGSGGSLTVFNGGYIPLPDNIIGAVNIFDIGDAMQTNNLFNIRYQIVLNDLYTLTSVSMVPYFMAMSHLAHLEQLLVGRQPIRYNRHHNKMYLDMNWDRWSSGGMIIVEAYKVVNPDTFRDAWNDRWLKQYAVQLIKRQWGNNMKKFSGMTLPGGIKFNGQQYYDEATAEITKLETEMNNSFGLPVTDMIG